MIEDALALIAERHKGQTDKLGKPYVLHLLAVHNRVRHSSIETQVTALLHDILEDTETTSDEILEAFGVDVASAVVALTKRHGESYEQYISCVRANEIAKKVKLADVDHNVSRLHLLQDEETRKRLWLKYAKANVLLHA